MASRGKRRREDSPDVKLSKFLSYICRHGAIKERLVVHEGGFIDVSEILKLRSCGGRYSVEDVRRVVENCPKQRFALRELAGDGDPSSSDGSSRLQIRANQAHSMQVEGLDLSPISDPDSVPVAVHGTYRKAWDIIKTKGLSRVQRNHIHFATGLPSEDGVISGMRSNCQVLIFLDVAKALRDGLQLFRSANDVILCPGNSEGFIPTEYFKEVREVPSGQVLYHS